MDGKVSLSRQALFTDPLLQALIEVGLAQWQTAQSRLVIEREQVESLRHAATHTQPLMEFSNSASYRWAEEMNEGWLFARNVIYLRRHSTFNR